MAARINFAGSTGASTAIGSGAGAAAIAALRFFAGDAGAAFTVFFVPTGASVGNSFPVALFGDSDGIAPTGGPPASPAFASVGTIAGRTVGVEGVAMGAEPFAGAVAGAAGLGAAAVFAVAAGAGGFLRAIGSLSVYQAKPMPAVSKNVAATVKIASRSPIFLRRGL